MRPRVSAGGSANDMIQTHPTSSRQFHIETWHLIAAALILLTMPVNYRGGAELPHPHAFFQFWSSGDRDAFDHHGRRLSEPPSKQLKHAIGFSLVRSTASVPSLSANSIHPPPDTPLLSDMGWPAEHADALTVMLVASLLGAVWWVRKTRIETPWSIPVGHEPRPETPPPR